MGYRYEFGAVASDTGARTSLRKLTLREFNDACNDLRGDVVGCDLTLATPFGRRKLLYADWTASGRSLKSVENHMLQEVLPVYGNTHTLSSATGRLSTFYRMESRQLIKQFLNATHEDALVFAASGATGAIQKFLAIMSRSYWDTGRGGSGSKIATAVEDRWGSYECTVCGVRLKNESLYRAHEHSEEHQRRATSAQHAVTERTSGACSQSAARISGGGQPTMYRLVVFILDPTAHHSLSLAFRELTPVTGPFVAVAFDCVELPLQGADGFAETALREELQRCRDMSSKGTALLAAASKTDGATTAASEVLPVCVLSAGSNATGATKDVARITEVIHSYGGFACWDMAAMLCHTEIDLNPADRLQAAVDAAFFAPHKLLGGPQTPGLLVLKKKYQRNAVPSCPGGGTVFFVSRKGHSYIMNAEEREEGGTPGILGDIRAGLVFHLHNQLPLTLIRKREFGFAVQLIRTWRKHKRIQLLGDANTMTTDRLGIVSFMIKFGNNLTTTKLESSDTSAPVAVKSRGGLYLHHNFVVTLLNDLFGVQVRGGCVCAGPFAHHLLGMNSDLVDAFERALSTTGQEVLRPGFIRASVNYSMSWDDVEFLAQAVCWVADFGWQFLPYYTFAPETGEWTHRSRKPSDFRKWLSSESLLKVTEMLNAHAAAGTASTEVSDVPRATKDPRKIAGAVALLPTGGANLKDNLLGAMAALKKRAPPQQPQQQTGTERPLSEYELRVKALHEKRERSASVVAPAATLTAATTSPTTHSGSYSPKADGTGALRNLPDGGPVPVEGAAHSREWNRLLPASKSLDMGKITTTITSGNFAATAAAAEGPTEQSSSFADKHSLLTLMIQPTTKSPLQQKDASSSTLFVPEKVPEDYEEVSKLNHELLESLYEGPRKAVLTEASKIPLLPVKWLNLIWFALPADAAKNLLRGETRPIAIDQDDVLPTGTVQTKRPIHSCFEVRDFDEDENASAALRAAAEKQMREMFETPPVYGGDNNAALGLLQVWRTEIRASRCLHLSPPLTTAPAVPSPDCDEFVAATASVATGVVRIPRALRRTVGQAMREFGMLRDGDRVLLGLSGGKDSLTLLHVLRDLQRRAPVKFELAAATVDPQTPDYNPRPLIPYMESLEVKYHFLSHPLIEMAKQHMQKNSICAFCSRMKRGMLYSCMRRYGYTVLVLGQHLDDACESFILSAFHNGMLNTMKAHYKVAAGDLRVCRPLIYTREKVLADFARENRLPVISDNCPACFSGPKERHRVKLLLAQQEFEFPHVFSNLLKTIGPLIAVDNTNSMSGEQFCSGQVGNAVISEHVDDACLAGNCNELYGAARTASHESTLVESSVVGEEDDEVSGSEAADLDRLAAELVME